MDQSGHLAHRDIKVRFAPSPTGVMHIGNVRAALFNFLAAEKLGGQFWVRIEDTDQARNITDGVKSIERDLHWLGLDSYHGPVFQSEHEQNYIRVLSQLIDNQAVYKCFCTPERLELMRAEQAKLGKPPRYDQACRNLSDAESSRKFAEGTPFIWRLALDNSQVYTLNTPERGTVTFDMANFADFPLTRSDESFTFIFANFVDDLEMGITHVIRGEDHLTNTAYQCALYQALGAEQPVFIHLPLLTQPGGKKLSKRDNGFSLDDVRDLGILPDALVHYLYTIGGKTLDGVYSREELLKNLDFYERLSAGSISYDLENLKSLNKKYIAGISQEKLFESIDNFSEGWARWRDELKNYSHENISEIAQIVREESSTLSDADLVISQLLGQPHHDTHLLDEFITESRELVFDYIKEFAEYAQEHDNTDLVAAELDRLKKQVKERGVPVKFFLCAVRFGITGQLKGFGLGQLVRAIPSSEIARRLFVLV